MPAGAPDPVRAVSLGLALLKAARVESWDDLVDTLRTDRPIRRAAGRHRPDRRRPRAAGRAPRPARPDPGGAGHAGSGYTVTVAVCDRCGQWMLSTGAVPRRCRLTIRLLGGDGEGCAGKAVVTGRDEQRIGHGVPWEFLAYEDANGRARNSAPQRARGLERRYSCELGRIGRGSLTIVKGPLPERMDS